MKKIIWKLFKIFLFITFYSQSIKIEEENIKENEQLKNRYMYYYQLMQKWFCQIQNHTSLELYFKNNNIKKIIIYGTGSLCDIFYKELRELNKIEILCMVDIKPLSNFYKLNKNINIISIEELKKYTSKADAIIITPVFDYNIISQNIKKSCLSCKLISLETIINNYS